MENEQPEIIRLFRGWLNNLFQTSKKDWETDGFNEQITNLVEVKIMFETALIERDKKESVNLGFPFCQRISCAANLNYKCIKMVEKSYEKRFKRGLPV